MSLISRDYRDNTIFTIISIPLIRLLADSTIPPHVWQKAPKESTVTPHLSNFFYMGTYITKATKQTLPFRRIPTNLNTKRRNLKVYLSIISRDYIENTFFIVISIPLSLDLESFFGGEIQNYLLMPNIHCVFFMNLLNVLFEYFM